MRVKSLFIAFIIVLSSPAISFAVPYNNDINPYYNGKTLNNTLAQDYPRLLKINKFGSIRIKKGLSKKAKQKIIKEIERKYHVNLYSLVSMEKEAANNKAMKKQARIAYNNFQKRTGLINSFKTNILYQNHIYVSELLHKNISSGQIFSNQYLYIFMSSSVPLSIWRIYARNIYKMKQNHIIMVLRGCIGGCVGKNFMKTEAFVHKVLYQHEKTVIAPIVLDPYLFRFYGIKRVPEFVFARHVELVNPDITAGVSVNLRNKPVSYSVLGAWSMNYVLSRLYAKSKDKKLLRLDNILNRSWFFGGNR